MRILLKNCTLLSKEKVNILIENSIYKIISNEPIDVEADIIYDLDKKIVTPGLTDINFLNDRYNDNNFVFEETKAFLKGGFTNIIQAKSHDEDTNKYNDVLWDLINRYNNYSNVNFSFIENHELTNNKKDFKFLNVSISSMINMNNINVDEEDIESVRFFVNQINEIAKNSNSIILSMMDKNINLFFKYFKNKNINVGFIDISSLNELKRIQKFKENGFKFYSIFYIDSFFVSSDFLTNDVKITKYMTNSKFPKQWEMFELNSAFKNGLIDIIVPSHTPVKIIEKFEFQKKGNPGAETFAAMVFDLAISNGVDLEVLKLSLFDNVWKFFNLDKRFEIAKGNIASLTVIDVDKFWFINDNDIISYSKWSQYEGKRVWGVPILTICNGMIGYDISKNGTRSERYIKSKLIKRGE